MDGFKIALSIKEKSSKVFDILSSTLVPHHDDSVGPFGEFVFDQSRPIIK